MIKQLIQSGEDKKFLKKYLIFEINESIGQSLINITEDQVKFDYLIPQKVKKIYKKEKQILSLIEEDLNDKHFKIMKGSVDGMNHVKNMQLADNKFTNISFITEHFPNLNRLQLSRNKV